MRPLDFNVKGQELTKRTGCRFDGIVAGTVGYLIARFYFYGNEWNDCTKVAGFWVGDREYAVVLDEDNTCFIPKEALLGSNFFVTITGAKEGYKLKTNKIEVLQEVR